MRRCKRKKIFGGNKTEKIVEESFQCFFFSCFLSSSRVSRTNEITRFFAKAFLRAIKFILFPITTAISCCSVLQLAVAIFECCLCFLVQTIDLIEKW